MRNNNPQENKDNKRKDSILKIALAGFGSALSLTGISVNLFIEPSLDVVTLISLSFVALGTFMIGYLIADYQYSVDPIKKEKAKAMKALRDALSVVTELRLKSSLQFETIQNPFDYLLLASLKKTRDLALQVGNKELAESYEKEITEIENKLNQEPVLEEIHLSKNMFPSESPPKRPMATQEAITEEQVNLVYDVVKQLVSEKGTAGLSDIIRQVYKRSNMSDFKVLLALEKLLLDGEIYEYTYGVYKTIED